MSKSIKIDDATYNVVAEFAEREDRPLSNALARLVKLGVANASEELSVEGQTAPMPKATPVVEVGPVVATTPNFPNGIDWAKIEKEVLNPDAQRKLQEQLKEAQKREMERGTVVGDLTEKDLATAKVTFKDRPDFKEPEEWDSHAWPTV